MRVFCELGMRDPIHNFFQSFTSLAPSLQISSQIRFGRSIFWAIHWASQNFLLLSRNFSLLDSLGGVPAVYFSPLGRRFHIVVYKWLLKKILQACVFLFLVVVLKRLYIEDFGLRKIVASIQVFGW